MPQNSGDDDAAVNRTFGPKYVVERPQPASPSPVTRDIVQQQSNSQYSSLDMHCGPVILEEEVHNPWPNTYFDPSKPSAVHENSSLPNFEVQFSSKLGPTKLTKWKRLA
ncbi:hypothetical protein ACOSQ2_021227 [Xanthoceras sorbifolium]